MALFNDLGSLAGLFMQPNKTENKQLASRAGVDTNDFSKIRMMEIKLLIMFSVITNQVR